LSFPLGCLVAVTAFIDAASRLAVRGGRVAPALQLV
jgi:hypothetical protein